MDQYINIRKGVEVQPTATGVETRAEACRENIPENGVVRTGKKLYRNPLPSTYKETELSEDLNDGMEWVFRDHRV